MVEILIILFIVMMLIGALIALESKDILSSIISLGAVGFMLSVVFLLLKAPDIAIVQVVVEILTLVILIRATITRDMHVMEDARSFFPFAVLTVLLLCFGIFSMKVFINMQFGTGVSQVASHYLNNGLADTGAANIVSGIILDYRAYDTLGEATVLFTAVLGAITILRRKAKNNG